MAGPEWHLSAGRVKKRLFICSDGTWQDGINNEAPMTNVSRFARPLQPIADDGCLQLVYYDSGVGNGTGLPGQTIDGATRRGISAKIRNAYSFISLHYQHEDEIILIGFSRGAFTVQCVASLIDQIGLLNKEDLQYLRPLYTLWANQEFRSWGGKQPLKEQLKEIVEALGAAQVTLRKVEIEACALWDTVAALGLPTLKLSPRPLSFVGKKVPGVVKHAFHALALNETRRQFKPLLWEQAAPECELVSQCWFMGSHSDVGGGNDDAGLAAVSLIWIASKLLALDVSFVNEVLFDFLCPQYISWEQDVNQMLGIYKATVKFSAEASTFGEVKESGWYWWFAGLKHRNKYLKSKSPFKLRSWVSSRLGYGKIELPNYEEVAPKMESIVQANTKKLPESAHDPEQRFSQLVGASFKTTIHFSVRLMMAAKRNKCHALKKWQTLRNDNLRNYVWIDQSGSHRIPEDQEYSLSGIQFVEYFPYPTAEYPLLRKGPSPPGGVTAEGNDSVPRESDLLTGWFDREHVGRSSSTMKSGRRWKSRVKTKEKSLSRFLHGKIHAAQGFPYLVDDWYAPKVRTKTFLGIRYGPRRQQDLHSLSSHTFSPA